MLVKQTATYMLAQIVSAILGFASVIIFTRMLTPAAYGVYVICMSVAAVVSALLFTWVRLSVLRFTAQGTTDIRMTALGAYIFSALSAPVAVLLVAYLADQSWSRAIAAVTFSLAIGFFEMSQEIQRANMQAKQYVRAAIMRAVVAFILGNIVVYMGGEGLALVLTGAAAFVLSAIAHTRAVWQAPRKPFDREIFKKFLAYGLPLTLSGLIFATNWALDRLMVAHFLGDAAAGQYGAAADLARQIITLPATAIASAIVPMAIRAFANEGKEAADRHLEDSFELLVALVLPCVIGLGLVSAPLSALILGPQFRDTAATLLPILSFAWLFQAISQNYVHSSFQIGDKPNAFVTHGAASLVVNVVLTLPLIIYYGLIGAAYALVAAEIGGVIIGFYLAKSSHPLPLIPARLLKVVLANLLMGAATYLAGRLTADYGIFQLVFMVAAGGITYVIAGIALDIIKARSAFRRLLAK